MTIRILLALLLALTILGGVAACQDKTVELGTTNLDTLVLEDSLTAGTSITAGTALVAGTGVTAGGELAVTGASTFSGAVTFAAGGDGLVHASQAFTYTAAAGGTVALFTVPDGDEWYVDSLILNVTTDWDCTGDDVTINLGDGGDEDGLCVLADAELQTADTEGTGWAAGWQCQVAATRGVYQDGTGGFLYAPSGSAETIDAVIDEVSGESITAGAATAHIWYRVLP